MATADEYAKWIVANKDRRGTPEFEKVAQAYKVARSQGSEKGGPGSPEQPAPEQSGGFVQGLGNLGAGALRGAGSIGATLLAPVDMANQALRGEDFWSLKDNRERRRLMDQGLRMMGADPESGLYATGKVGGELAGTAGMGPSLAVGVKGLGATPSIIKALETWGMSTGQAPKGALANILTRGTAGGATGAAAGGLINPEHATTGAGIGAGVSLVAPPVIGVAHKLGSKLRQTLYPTPGEIAVRAAGDKAGDVISAMREETSRVPGVNLTAGQASVPANSAEFAALQKLVAQDRAPSLFHGAKGITGQQEAARQAAVRGIGRSADDLSNAIEARRIATSKNYEKAFDVPVKPDDDLIKIAADPLYKDEVKGAMKAVASKNAERVRRGLPPKDSLTEELHAIKEGLDNKLYNATKPDAPAMTKAQKDSIQSLKKDLVDWLGRKNPVYDEARLAHIEMSKPIEQMKVGQSMERALVAPGTGAERAASFGGAVRSAETSVSKSTGRPKIDALTPAQRDTINAIQDDFKRNALYKELAQKGGGKSLSRRIGAPTAPPTGFFQPMVSAARSWLNTVLGSGYEKGLERLAPIMADPEKMAALMQAATPAEKKIIDGMIAKYVSAGAISATSGQDNQSGRLANELRGPR